MKDKQQIHTRTEWWTKYVLLEKPANPTWNEIENLLSHCSTFSWIPSTGACEVQIMDTADKFQF